jgi:hypothetical protein
MQDVHDGVEVATWLATGVLQTRVQHACNMHTNTYMV